jgi:hypothetical protein
MPNANFEIGSQKVIANTITLNINCNKIKILRFFLSKTLNFINNNKTMGDKIKKRWTQYDFKNNSIT